MVEGRSHSGKQGHAQLHTGSVIWEGIRRLCGRLPETFPGLDSWDSDNPASSIKCRPKASPALGTILDPKGKTWLFLAPVNHQALWGQGVTSSSSGWQMHLKAVTAQLPQGSYVN